MRDYVGRMSVQQWTLIGLGLFFPTFLGYHTVFGWWKLGYTVPPTLGDMMGPLVFSLAVIVIGILALPSKEDKK